MTQKKGHDPVIVVVNDWSTVCRALQIHGATVLDVDEQNEAFRALKEADGLILTGGGDVAPQRYNGTKHRESYGIDKRRDQLEFELVRVARRRRIPIMGICRGHQLLNVAFGGTLHSHVPDVTDGDVKHGHGNHVVHLDPRSRLAQSLDTEVMRGTTLHHQAVDRVGKGLQPIGWASDGIIETIESRPGVKPYVLGTQFHPEMDWQYDSDAQGIFEHFVKIAKRHRASLNREPRWERIAELIWKPRSYTTSSASTIWTAPGTLAWEDYTRIETEDDRRFDEWLKLNTNTVDEIAAAMVDNGDVDSQCINPPCPTAYDCAQWGDCAAAAVKLTRARDEEWHGDGHLKRGNPRKEV